ncbi:MAG: 6-phosphofructokinase [Oscillospiraceae bacterium]
MKVNIMIAQSGGPTSAINASLSGAILEGIRHERIDKIYGALNGISGVIERRIIELQSQIKTDEQFKLLECTPAMALGSCRLKMSNYTQDDTLYHKILNTFIDYNIGMFFYIGGNDSMDTANKLNQFFLLKGHDIKVIGIPKTIDNDLKGTDHAPGYGSAAKFIAASMTEIARDCSVYNTKSVTIVEIMGRNAGWLTAAAALPRTLGFSAPHLIYMPEVNFDLKQFENDIRTMHQTYNSVVIAVSEGIKFADGNYVSDSESTGQIDNFGHKYIAGAGKFLERYIANNINCKVRSIELNILQRCAAHMLSATDIAEAKRIGQFAVRFALAGKTGVMTAFTRVSNVPYISDITTIPLCEVANLEQKVPLEWISPSKNDVSQEIYSYILPLIYGEVQYPTKNGIPNFFSFEKNLI